MKRLLAMVLLLAGTVSAAEEGVKEKYAIVLQAGAETNEGRARAIHALLYAADLAEHGHTVVLIFDGAGAGWAAELDKPEHPFHPHYRRIKELAVVEEICDYCADAHGTTEKLSEQQARLLAGDYEGHPSVAGWVGKGYRIIVL